MKIVPEHINEVYNFERVKKDKLSSLGVGQKQLIISWLDEMEIKNYVINDDLTIDVEYNIYLKSEKLTKFPDYIQFNEVKYSFFCSCNQLTSLKGCPKIVHEIFSCRDNQLTSLEGCPKIVYNNFYCSNNKLISLEGCPEYVGGLFECENNTKQFTKEDVLKYCNVKKQNIYV